MSRKNAVLAQIAMVAMIATGLLMFGAMADGAVYALTLGCLFIWNALTGGPSGPGALLPAYGAFLDGLVWWGLPVWISIIAAAYMVDADRGI